MELGPLTIFFCPRLLKPLYRPHGKQLRGFYEVQWRGIRSLGQNYLKIPAQDSQVPLSWPRTQIQGKKFFSSMCESERVCMWEEDEGTDVSWCYLWRFWTHQVNTSTITRTLDFPLGLGLPFHPLCSVDYFLSGQKKQTKIRPLQKKSVSEEEEKIRTAKRVSEWLQERPPLFFSTTTGPLVVAPVFILINLMLQCVRARACVCERERSVAAVLAPAKKKEKFPSTAFFFGAPASATVASSGPVYVRVPFSAHFPVL